MEIPNTLMKNWKSMICKLCLKTKINCQIYQAQQKIRRLIWKKSGIYSIKCSDCDKVFYGQTKRSVEKCFNKEHSNGFCSVLNVCVNMLLFSSVEFGDSTVCLLFFLEFNYTPEKKCRLISTKQQWYVSRDADDELLTIRNAYKVWSV